MNITMILATGRYWELGANGKLPWRLPEDLQHFKELTTGKIIVMGRKTFESFPKPLPNRTHWILTREESYQCPEGVETFHNIIDILTRGIDLGVDLMIIGGGEIYEQFLPHADKIIHTRVEGRFPEADTFFQVPDHEQGWKLIQMSTHTSKTGQPYTIRTLTRA